MVLSTMTYQKHPGWTSLASVCREWQHALEKVKFYKLKLGVSCIDDFGSLISPRKRDIIHHICLEIELPRYTAACCSKPRPKRWSEGRLKRRSKRISPPENANSIVGNGIWRLFSILSTWRRAAHLALEITAYSPSDCEHWFKNICLSTDNVVPDRNATPDAWRAMNPHHDLQHCWVHGKRITNPPWPAALRLFGSIFPVSHETWSHLQSLALTSQLLQSGPDKTREIEVLLCRASALVQKVPKLHTFRRCLDHWSGTWRLEWSPGVVKAWQLAASKLSSHRFEIRQEYVQGDITSHGDAIYHLELPCKVIDPASLWQIRREAWSLEE
ncbi:hypothetical protein LY78DRAFT_743255 [Colletotrichum sublineola]|nr:hypothetical protein LY78DRAFT_743255 [Colletotrichum sublineola]